jgi:hypothetical protein
LSWRYGDARGSEQRVEVGRFLHSEVPQLGLLDGVEWVKRTEGGDRWGFSAGLQPEWTAEMASGDDVATSAFYRHVGGDKGEFALTGGAQKTWHKGEPDRDLVLGDVSWRPNERWWLYASAWLDWYDSGDAPKSSGFELTQAMGSANFRPDKRSNIGLTASQFHWPMLLKNELPPTSLATLSNGSVERIGLNGWREVTKDVRLYARVDRWSSDNDAGVGGELRSTWRNLLFENGDISFALFENTGELTTVTGARLSAYRSTDLGTWTVGYEAADYEQDTGNGVTTSLMQQVLRGSWDMRIGDGWDLSLTVDSRFGDQQDAQSLGFWLQWRF